MLRDAYERAKIQPPTEFIAGVPDFQDTDTHDTVYVVKTHSGDMIAGTGLAFSGETLHHISETFRGHVTSHWVAGPRTA